MSKCKDCKWWVKPPQGDYDSVSYPEDPDTFERMEMPFNVYKCECPKVFTLERAVVANGVTIMDGSGFFAQMYTGEDFGCVNWEPKP
jgi:hypothetical protein